jgi:hypothetical protein
MSSSDSSDCGIGIATFFSWAIGLTGSTSELGFVIGSAGFTTVSTPFFTLLDGAASLTTAFFFFFFFLPSASPDGSSFRLPIDLN